MSEDNETEVAANAQSSANNDKEFNFSRLRQQYEQLEKRLNDQTHENEQYRELIMQLQNRSEVQELDELDELDLDDLTTRSHVEKLAERKAMQIAEAAIERERERIRKEAAEEELKKLPKQLRQEFPDFDQVVNDKNLDYLRVHQPDLHFVLLQATNNPSIAGGRAVYRALKSFCPSPEIEEEKRAIERNSKKPGSIDAIGSPSGVSADPKRWSDGEKERRWRAMEERAKRR